MWFVVFSKGNEHLKPFSGALVSAGESLSPQPRERRTPSARADRRIFFAEFLAYRTRQGFFGSNFQPGIRNCIAAASSREPEGSFR